MRRAIGKHYFELLMGSMSLVFVLVVIAAYTVPHVVLPAPIIMAVLWFTARYKDEYDNE